MIIVFTFRKLRVRDLKEFRDYVYLLTIKKCNFQLTAKCLSVTFGTPYWEIIHEESFNRFILPEIDILFESTN